MAQEIDIKEFREAVVRELIARQRRLPEWFPTGPNADPLWPMEALERCGLGGYAREQYAMG